MMTLPTTKKAKGVSRQGVLPSAATPLISMSGCHNTATGNI